MADNVFNFKRMAPDGDVFAIKLKPSATNGELFSAVAQHLSTPERPVMSKDIRIDAIQTIVTLETWKTIDAKFAANGNKRTYDRAVYYNKPDTTLFVWVRHDTPGA